MPGVDGVGPLFEGEGEEGSEEHAGQDALAIKKSAEVEDEQGHDSEADGIAAEDGLAGEVFDESHRPAGGQELAGLTLEGKDNGDAEEQVGNDAQLGQAENAADAGL